MDRADCLSALLQLLYAAPGTRDGWQPFLDALCDALNGSAANFIAHDSGPDGSIHASIEVTSRTDPAALRLYQQHWHTRDPWMLKVRGERIGTGVVVVGEQLVPRRLLHRSDFYNEFSRGFDIADDLAGMIEVSPSRLACVSTARTHLKRIFEKTHTKRQAEVVRLLQLGWAGAADGRTHHPNG